jgi:ElaB/YqjD/DUF883 family membrane-anchored ribosome-binding protein
MNTKTIEKRINRNLDRTKRDLAALKDDTVTGLSMKIGQLADGPIKSTTEAVKTLNKTIGQGLTEYNTRVQGAVSKVPGDINKKASRYPWVAISMAAIMGLILGVTLKPARHVMPKPQDDYASI